MSGETMLIGLHGRAGAGKDTFADHLVAEHGFVKRGFADPLYEEVAQAFNVEVEWLRDRTRKEESQPALAIGECENDEFVCLFSWEDWQAPRSPRWILQKWGTEYRRAQSKVYWLAKMTDFIYQNHRASIVVPDCRFENEARFVVGHGGHVIEIIRPGAPLVHTHSSEAGLEAWLKSQVVFNTRDIFHLKLVADAAIRSYTRTNQNFNHTN